jgi:hypothetical protein
MAEYNPADLLSIKEVADRLRATPEWVREKIRRRCPNPMPVMNLGNHLLFHWPQVCAWMAEVGRGTAHAPHIRSKKVTAIKKQRKNAA